MSLLPAAGTLTYNGHTFNGSTKSRVSGKMVYDQAQRTVVYTVYSFDVLTYITNSGSDTGDEIETVVNRLSRAGQRLTVTDRGLFELDVNLSLGGQMDVVWGPKPQVVELEQVGGNLAYRLRWTCEVAIPQCSNARYSGLPLAFNYDVVYSITDQGLTRRTYSGYVEIPLTRSPGSRRVRDSADRMRESINPPMLLGFRRTSREFKLSADKRTLNFTIVDEQMTGDGIPEGCTNANGAHTVSSEPNNLTRWQSTISASYQVASGKPKTLAWNAFFLLIDDRLRSAKAATRDADSVILTGLEMAEGLYSNGLEMEFSVSYTFTSSIQKLMKNSGQWRKVPGTDWNKWATSIADALGPRGHAGLKFRPEDDAIIDLCVDDNAGLGDKGRPVNAGGLTGTIGLSTGIRPDGTWIAYRCWLEIEADPGTTVTRTLPAAEMPDPKRWGGPMSSRTMRQQEWGQVPIIPSKAKATVSKSKFTPEELAQINGLELIGKMERGYEPEPARFDDKEDGDDGGTRAQQRLAPEYRVRLKGFAVRVLWRIPPPVLVGIGGVPAVPNGKAVFRQWISGNWNGLPIYTASWNIPYVLIGTPGGEIPAPPNPAARFGG